LASFIAAVAGLGFMGPTHIQALRRLGVPIAGILGIDLEEGRRNAERLNIHRVYSDYDEMLSDPQANVIHICTPNHLHHPMAKAALLAGKHVICEKPLANTSAESGELKQLAKEKDLVAVVNYNLRFYPLCQEARARVQAGELGEVRLVHGAYLQDWLFLPTDWNWRIDPAMGGPLRAVADIGTHWLDMIQWLTGLHVTEILADMSTFIKVRQKPRQEVRTFDGKLVKAAEADEVPISSEDCATILLRFDNSARGALVLSQISAGRKNYFWWELSGSRASLRWDQENPNQLWLGYREQPNQNLIKDPALLSPEARRAADFPGGHAEGYPDTFYQLFKRVYACLREDLPVDPREIPTFDTGHHELVLCEAIQRSAMEGRWMSLPVRGE